MSFKVNLRKIMALFARLSDSDRVGNEVWLGKTLGWGG
jgi:hypothetical protein